MIREGMTVILDSGSTTLLIAEALVRMTNITVITNSLPAAFTTAENKDITGGMRRYRAAQNAFDARHNCRTFAAGNLRRFDVCRRRRYRRHQRYHHL